MSLFHNIEIFSLGAAAVIDTALLMVLTERSNRRRLLLPLLLLVLGAWLLHGGAAVKTLLAASQEPWALNLHWLALLAMSAGLLLMPSAMLHGVLRAGRLDEIAGAANWRYALFYLPLLLLIPAAQRLAQTPQLPLATTLADWIMPYACWLITVNTLAGLRFMALRHHYVATWARLFMRVAGYSLLVLALLQGAIFFLLLHWWPQWQPLWLLLAFLSPIVMALLIGYFIIRYHFMQLVLGRVFIYGVVVVAAILFHQIFLQELWHTLSDHYRVDFAIVEGIVLIALVLWVRPLRQRSAEALRYLLGSRVDTLRRNTRRFALQMSAEIDKPPQTILAWFCREGPQALEIGTLAVWLLSDDGRIESSAGNVAAIDAAEITGLYRLIKSRGHSWCTPFDAPVDTLQDQLQQLDVALAVIIEHADTRGLVLFGPASAELHDEQLNALLMVVEQLAVTLSNSVLQARRIDAERRAHQNEKLSTLGLIASSMAHEVKNPLASIRTITTVLAEDLGPDSEYAEDLRLVIGEVDRLNTTIGHLLRFARPAAVTADDATPIVEVISGILHIMRHLSLKHAVTLDNRLPAALPAVHAQENALREIFFNLIVNAIEAAAMTAGGRVTVEGRRQDDAIVIDVSDNGPGIAAQLQPHIFEPFVSAKTDGTGLGLYLVGRHIHDIGSTIECRSEPGRGTCFSVRLPIATRDDTKSCH